MKPRMALYENREAIVSAFTRHTQFSNLRVIGSVEQCTDDADSDIDFYVDAEPDTTLLDIGRLINEMEQITDYPVDIITSQKKYNHSLKERFLACGEVFADE